MTTQAPDDGWGAAVVCADEDPTGAFSVARSIRRVDGALSILVLLGGAQLGRAGSSRRVLRRLLSHALPSPRTRGPAAAISSLRPAARSGPDLIEHGELVLNLETYQAAVSGNSLDLTYMEYELLKFLASNPGKVFTRETLLSRVWGYDYYGGARTVDVHIRRLRSKLGEEHAAYIHTVRSVGYRFGQSRWDP